MPQYNRATAVEAQRRDPEDFEDNEDMEDAEDGEFLAYLFCDHTPIHSSIHPPTR